VNGDLAEFLGFMVGDGHISKVKRQLGLTTVTRRPRASSRPS